MFNKLFFEIKMTYKKVIIFALAVAFLTALFLVLPFTIHTSLGNLGTSLEAWIIFALIIIMNCETPKDAAIKTFIFFLISQPLIYLLQVPFSSLGWQIFMFYPRWFVLTLLTIPGAFVAWYIKKDNLLSGLILSVATSFLMYQCVYYLPSVIINFPNSLLSMLLCFASGIALNFILLKNKKSRILSIVITSLVFFILAALQVSYMMVQVM